MSHPQGAYLGGVRSVEDLRLRCHIDEDTGCWHWRLAFSQGAPRVHIRLPDGTMTTMRGRRAALRLSRGTDLPSGHRAFAAPCCDAADCCNPEHSRSGTRAAEGRALAISGKSKNLPAKRAASIRTARTRCAKLDMEKARAIRASSLSTYQLAALYGVAQNTIHRIKAGVGWAEGARNSSVFNLAA